MTPLIKNSVASARIGVIMQNFFCMHRIHFSFHWYQEWGVFLIHMGAICPYMCADKGGTGVNIIITLYNNFNIFSFNQPFFVKFEMEVPWWLVYPTIQNSLLRNTFNLLIIQIIFNILKLRKIRRSSVGVFSIKFTSFFISLSTSYSKFVSMDGKGRV